MKSYTGRILPVKGKGGINEGKPKTKQSSRRFNLDLVEKNLSKSDERKMGRTGSVGVKDNQRKNLDGKTWAVSNLLPWNKGKISRKT